MGFVDRSGDIILDAVLTDIGRERLARSDGSFKITGYTFGDDEVDYTLFNPQTGSAFIDEDILSLPVFEANVNERVNLNYPLMIITNPELKYIPKLKADNLTVTIGEEDALTAGVTIRFFQSTNQNARNVPVEIQDTGFKIEMSHDLIFIEDESVVDLTAYGTAIYVLPRDAQLIQANQGSQVTFKIRPQSINNLTWDTLGTGTAGSRTISTKIKATGLNSGLSTTVTIAIEEQFTR